MQDNHRAGAHAERLVALYLQLQGFDVLRRNALCAGVQVDLVARLGSRLILVEVKLRRPGAPLVASQALGRRQHRRLRRAAAWALERCPWASSVRLDLVGVTWRPGAARLQIDHLCDVD